MYDVIIIGAGCIGSSIARRLSRYDLDILVLEKNNEICTQTTKANSAIIHGGYDAKPGSLKAELNVLGNSMYSELSKELDFDYKKIGSLVLGFNESEKEKINELYNQGIKNGVKGMEILDGEAVKELENFVSDNVISALYCKEAGIIDPFNYTYAMMENAIDNGVILKNNERVIDIIDKKDYIKIMTENNIYRSKYLVNAAGIYSADIANIVGDNEFKIIPTKGVYRLLAKNPYLKLNKILFQTPTDKGKGVLLTPTYAGNTMIGPTADKIEDNMNTEKDSLEDIDRLSKRSVPSIDVNKTIRVFTGIRAKPDTGDFMIYPSKKLKGLINVGGIESPGLSSAPAIAKYVEDILLDIGMSNKKNDSYNPIRQGILKLEKLSKIEREELIKKDKDYNKIICRCERITKGEILDAINRTNGARSVNGVKRRVRAGMGYCQGNHCRPLVEKILEEELDIKKEDIIEDKTGKQIVMDILNREREKTRN